MNAAKTVVSHAERIRTALQVIDRIAERATEAASGDGLQLNWADTGDWGAIALLVDQAAEQANDWDVAFEAAAKPASKARQAIASTQRELREFIGRDADREFGSKPGGIEIGISYLSPDSKEMVTIETCSDQLIVTHVNGRAENSKVIATTDEPRIAAVVAQSIIIGWE